MADHRHRQRPPLAGGADHVLDGDLDALEADLTELLGDAADHLQRTLLDARLVHGADERRDPAVPFGFRVGAGQHQAPVGHIGVAGPDLVPVEDVVLAVLVEHGGSGQRRQVRARAGFGEALAPALGAVDHPGQEALLDLLAAVVSEADDEVAEAGPRRGAGPGQFFVEDDVVDRRQFLAAVLLGPGQPEEPALVQGAVPLAGLGPVLVTGGRKFLGVHGQPLPQALPERRFLGGITKVQDRCPPT